MKITNIILTPINTPRHGGITCGHVIVEMETDDGVTGLGEMSDLQHLPRYHFDVEGLEWVLNDMLVGESPFDRNAINSMMESAFPQGMHIYDKSRAIKHGVDLALWDIQGKALSLPVSQLLGGTVRKSLPIAYPIFRSQRDSDVNESVEMVRRRLHEGFDCFRVYVGGNLELDERLLNTIASEFGDRVKIKSLDFSNLRSSTSARRFIDRLENVKFDIVESPSRRHDVDDLVNARRTIDYPVSEHVYAFEWMFQLLRARAVDIFNISCIAIGGISNAVRATNIAYEANVDILIGTTQELSIGTAAAAHVGVSALGNVHASDPVGPVLYKADVVSRSVQYVNGELQVPNGPGLGIELDRNKLAMCESELTWKASSAHAAVHRSRG